MQARPADEEASWLPGSILKRLREPIFEPFLHPSQGRIRTLALSMALGHPIFFLAWAYWLPQPYESVWLRLALSAMAAGLLLFPRFTAPPAGWRANAVITLVLWLSVPLFFSWMYFCNGRNEMWFATMAAMFLIYYHAADWRLATVGVALALPSAWGLFLALGPPAPAIAREQAWTHTLVLGFCWYMGLVLGLSASNLRRAQLKQALGTMGIMAHELRTPLATMSLIGEALRTEAGQADPGRAAVLLPLAGRLHATVGHINRQIDTQISNARLMSLSGARERVSAAQVVRAAVDGYPYRSRRERECVRLEVDGDFEFRGTAALFVQVVDNLLKNALHSLAGNVAPSRPGDLEVEVRVQGRRGFIVVSDRGTGIDQQIKPRLFQLFASTHQGSGHGLGLAFCQRVVHEAGGSIRGVARAGRGARFIIELPCLHPVASAQDAPCAAAP